MRTSGGRCLPHMASPIAALSGSQLFHTLGKVVAIAVVVVVVVVVSNYFILWARLFFPSLLSS